MLNQIAYRVFKTPKTMADHDPFMLESLKSALQRLVNRDMRLKLFPD